MQRSSIALPGSISVVAIRLVMDAGLAAGMRPEVLLAAADIAEADLADPDARLPVAASIAMWEAISRFAADPELGVRAGSVLRLKQLGLLGYVACFSMTLCDALHRWQRYYRVFTDLMDVKLAESARQGVFSLGYVAPGPQHPAQQDFMLAGWVQVCREMTGADVVPLEVTFTHDQPSSSLAHREHFRCPLRFGARTASIVFRRSDLDLPVTKGDKTLVGYLSKHAEHVLASLVKGDTWQHGVRAAIWGLLSEGKPTLERVAKALGVPTRTLQRRLAAEETTLQHETEEIRKTMAMAILKDRSLSIADVAFLLGYTEPSAFFRSFRRWTGKTPQDFRRAAA